MTVKTEGRADRRILPVVRVVGPPPERERGMLFGGLVDDRPRTADLSLFPDLEPERPRVLLLEIVDRTGVPIRSKGRGAPLEARLAGARWLADDPPAGSTPANCPRRAALAAPAGRAVPRA